MRSCNNGNLTPRSRQPRRSRPCCVRRGTASSLVECLNSVARMQQSRHRRMTQELLDLKRLYWNCRTFRTGRRQKQTPYAYGGCACRQPIGGIAQALTGATPSTTVRDRSCCLRKSRRRACPGGRNPPAHQSIAAAMNLKKEKSRRGILSGVAHHRRFTPRRDSSLCGSLYANAFRFVHSSRGSCLAS